MKHAKYIIANIIKIVSDSFVFSLDWFLSDSEENN